jgi:hypothetical protein
LLGYLSFSQITNACFSQAIPLADHLLLLGLQMLAVARLVTPLTDLLPLEDIHTSDRPTAAVLLAIPLTDL